MSPDRTARVVAQLADFLLGGPSADVRGQSSRGFTDSDALEYEKDIARIATPDARSFRGPVAWMIRTNSERS